jgi:hypothetical protein
VAGFRFFDDSLLLLCYFVTFGNQTLAGVLASPVADCLKLSEAS